MSFIPRHDFVVVQMEKPATETKHGIALPESVRDDRTPGEVLALGPGRTTEEGKIVEITDLAVGDRVVFNKYSALELDEAERLYLIRNTDIGCRLDD
jgi:chaperonin GroES